MSKFDLKQWEKIGPRTYRKKRADGSYDYGTLFDSDNDEESVSKTQPQHADSCSVEHILKRHAQGHDISHLYKRNGVFSDVSQVPSYQEALDYVQYVKTQFEQIDPYLRDKFNNDPDAMFKFMNDPSNYDKCVEYGLFEKREDEIKNDNAKNEQPSTPPPKPKKTPEVAPQE